MISTFDKPASYVEHLPATFREGEQNDRANFLGRFLKIFEKILSGIDDGAHLEIPTAGGETETREIVGIEQLLDAVHDFFDPLFAPTTSETSNDFISYLSSWIALLQNPNWEKKSQRRLLKEIASLYKKRGTSAGLTRYLEIYLSEFNEAELSVQEFLNGIQVGEKATIGEDTVVGGAPPHFFFVQISQEDLQGFRRFNNLVANTRAILDLEKPSHTYYAILYDIPGMVVGERSTVDLDTLIGSRLGIFA